MDSTLDLLKTLTEASGVPGYEDPIRKVIHKYFESYGKIQKDQIGSLICAKAGKSSSPKVMLAGHMDEIGFMVKYITDDGFIKFLPLGGWFDQVLLSQRVIIHTSKGNVVGVIGVKPPHFIEKDKRGKVVEKKDMYIDIGATSKKEVEEAGVKVGDPIVPRADFNVLANGKTYMSKAFDDRVGIALMISIMESLKEIDHPNMLYAAATVMEEFSLSGAKTSVEIINPDVAIVLEAGLAGDVPDIKSEESPVGLGKGPNVLIYDAMMIPNLKLRDFVLSVAEEQDIPVQISALEIGATDGAMIHTHKTGVPTIVIAVPARHVHTDSSMIHRDDYDRTVELIREMLIKMDKEFVESLTN
ncbi:MAG: M42 family metallopeptidase [Anaerolineaceae bacterium]|nr:M42 family metallopeptidase [Anaerolineaceae bacterium]